MKDYSRHSQDAINQEFLNACYSGDLALVRHLLTHPDLRYPAQIDAKESNALGYACASNHLELVRYLLTSPELSKHADIHAQDNKALKWACSSGHLEVVKYLVASAELSEHAKVETNNYYALRYACQENHLEVVNFFLYDLRLPVYMQKTHQKPVPAEQDSATQYLRDFCNDEVVRLVQKRDLFFQINGSLGQSNDCAPKSKI